MTRESSVGKELRGRAGVWETFSLIGFLRRALKTRRTTVDHHSSTRILCSRRSPFGISSRFVFRRCRDDGDGGGDYDEGGGGGYDDDGITW